MRDISLLNEAISAFKQSSGSVKSLLDKKQQAISSFNDVLGRVKKASDTIASSIEAKSTSVSAPPVDASVKFDASQHSKAEAPAPAPKTSSDILNLIGAAQNAAIPAAQQNVIDSSMRSNYVYTVDARGDSTLIGLEDRLRRATDTYDATVANAKGGYCSWIPSQNGLPVYLNRNQMISAAKENLVAAQQSFDAHKVFLADPAARAMAEVAYQIHYGAPSANGPELSAFDKILVSERRAGNTSTDGSIALLLNKTKT